MGCFSHRSDPKEVCCLKPVGISSLPESKRSPAQGFWAPEAASQTDQPVALSLLDRQTPAWESAQKSRANREKRALMAGPVAKTSLVSCPGPGSACLQTPPHFVSILDIFLEEHKRWRTESKASNQRSRQQEEC